MNEHSIVQIVALLGWLILCGSALASYRLDWSKSLKMVLTWVAIFGAVYIVFDLVRGG
jgi:type IV secretory pathway VirB2 component (pilin)